MSSDGTLERLAAACLLPAFLGTTAPGWVRRRAAAGLGGVVLYGRNVSSPEQLGKLCEELHAESPALLVVRDLHRHPWQERAVASLLRLHPDVTVVEMGLPAHRPTGTAAYVRTFGAARVNAQAAAELLRPSE